MKKTARVRRRDNQRKKVYNWEDVVLNIKNKNKRSLFIDKLLTKNQCQNLAWEIQAAFNMPCSWTILDGYTNQKNAAYRGNLIKIPDKMKFQLVVLHECAHGIIRNKLGDKPASHGPEFMSVFFYLLNKWANLAKDELKQTAKSHKIKFVCFSKVPQMRKWFRPRLAINKKKAIVLKCE